MKRIGITQRVDYIKSYGESRDALDSKWYDFCIECDFIPIPLPNLEAKYISYLLDVLALDAIVFSGGNSISSLDIQAEDVSLARDTFETELFKEAAKRNIKIIGVCRGMQMLNILMDGKLSKVQDHVAVRHTLISIENHNMFPKEVNSYHNWGIKKDELSKKLKPLATDKNGNIEAFINTEKTIMGIMWHPEREHTFNTYDIKLFKDFYEN